MQFPNWFRRGGVKKPFPSPEALLVRVRKQVLDWSKLRVKSDLDVEKILPLDAGVGIIGEAWTGDGRTMEAGSVQPS